MSDLLEPYQTQPHKPDGLSVRNVARGLDEATPVRYCTIYIGAVQYLNKY